MNKKILVISGLIITMIFVASSNLNSIEEKILEQTFAISAIYFVADKYVEINFEDKSNKTKYVTLEILGMPESFHKEYGSSTFVEKIPFVSTPKYGWQSIPVVFEVEHEEFGKISIKIEIRSAGESQSKIIFNKL